MRAVILAAGMGRRLGNGMPKCLTALSDDVSILDLQLAHLRPFTQNITIVVGYKKELVMGKYPACSFVYNDRYDVTNTARSLSKALEVDSLQDLLWINGDVVLSSEVIAKVLSVSDSSMATKRCDTAEEEVKYQTDDHGRIIAVSKELKEARGEAVGVNMVRAESLGLLIEGLNQCGDQDYFEKGIEYAIIAGLRIFEADVSDLPCIEVDFAEDLARAKTMLRVCL